MTAHASQMPRRLLFNCDMGESYGPWQMGADEQLMPLIDQANIACGAHASDPSTMQRTIALAVQHKVAIGAHPGYPDRLGFGRRDFPLEGNALQASLWHQVGALAGQCQAQGVSLRHIKPHGALYNKMMREEATLHCILQAVATYDSRLPLLVKAGDTAANQKLQALADGYGVNLQFEAFADRAYDDNGQLAARELNGAVLQHAHEIEAQAQRLMAQGQVHTLSGQSLNIQAHTLCVHGDNPAAPAALTRLRLHA